MNDSCIDDNMDNSNVIHCDSVPCVSCHNELEDWVPLANLSEYSFFVHILLSEQSSVTFVMKTFEQNFQTDIGFVSVYFTNLLTLFDISILVASPIILCVLVLLPQIE